MKNFFVFLIRAYQITLSPFIGAHCRFAPTCSGYAIDALDKKGIAKGVLASALRVLRCHPFSPGGYDPA